MISNALSAISQGLSVETAARVSADNALSTAVSVVSNALSALEVRVSTLSAAPGGSGSVTSTELSHAVSVLSNAISNLTSAHNVLSNRVSANSAVGGAGSVTSTEASAISAQAASALSQAISVLSPTTRVLATSTNVSAAVMTTIAGLSVSVDAGGVYQMQAALIVTRGQAAQAYGYGLSYPPMKHIRGKVWAGVSVGNLVTTLNSLVPQEQPFEGDSASTSIIISTISMAVLSVLVTYGAIMKVSTTGTIHLLAKASTTTAALTFHDGSYIQVMRIA